MENFSILWYVVSVFVSFAVGAIWYGKLFTKQWIKAVKYECPCGADIQKGEKCTCKNNGAGINFILQFFAIAILSFLYFVLTPICICYSILVIVAVSGWTKSMLKFQIPEFKRWMSLCAIDVGYFAIVSAICIAFSLI